MSAAGPGRRQNSDTATLIAIVPKGAASQVRVRLRTYHGRHLVDARVFTPLARHAEQWIPSREGFALDVSKLPLLRDAIMEAEAKARSLKLIRER